MNPKRLFILATSLYFFSISSQLFAIGNPVVDTCYWNYTRDFDNDGIPYYRTLAVDFFNGTTGNVNVEVWFDDSCIFKFNNVTIPYTRYFDLNGGDKFCGIPVIVKVKVKDSITKKQLNEWVFTEPVIFESRIDDGIVRLSNSSNFSRVIDNDGDGYFSTGNFNTFFENSYGNIGMYYKVSACKYPLTEEPCWLYTAGKEKSNIKFPEESGQLHHGIYKLGVEGYDATSNAILHKYSVLQDSVKLETVAEDQLPQINFRINDLYVGNITDRDSDGYFQSFSVFFDADVDSGTYNLSVKIYIKSGCCSSRLPETPFFVIKDHQQELHEIFIKRNCCTEKIDISLEFYIGTSLVATINQEADEDLNDILLESFEDDSPFRIKSYTVSDLYDHDGDGLASKGKIDVVFDVFKGSDTVFVESYYVFNTIFAIPVSLFWTDKFLISPEDTTVSFEFDVLNNCNDMVYKGLIWLTIKPKSEIPGNNYPGLFYDKTDFKEKNFEKPEEDALLFIKSVVRSDSVDLDGDGYFRRFSYQINIDPDNPSNPRCMLQPCDSFIYFTNSGSQIFGNIDTSSSDNFNIEWLTIKKGIYNLKTDLYRQRDKVSYIYEYEPTIVSAAIDSGIKLEPSAEDDVLLKIDATIENGTDRDNDGYISSCQLKFAVTAGIGTHEVYGKLYCKLSSQSSNYSYSVYKTSQSISVSANDTSYIIFPLSGDPELSFDKYDFKFSVYTATSPSWHLSTIDPEKDINLDDIKFETEDEDKVNIHFTDFNLKNPVDMDKDGYSRSVEVHFKSFLDEGYCSVYGKVYFKESGSSNYSLLYAIPSFVIGTDTQAIGSPLFQLQHNEYDFKVEFYYTVDNSLLTCLYSEEYPDLHNLKFESEEQDIGSFSINNIYFDENRIDKDNDGYFRSGNLHLNVSVDAGIYHVILALFNNDSSGSEYILVYSTPLFILSDTSEKDFCIIIDSSLVMLPHGSYDFKIVLFNETSDRILTEKGPSDDLCLTGQKFEMIEEDHFSSIPENDIERFRVYPNPVLSDLFIIKNGLIPNEIMTFRLFTEDGQLVKLLESSNIPDVFKISFEYLKPGLYFLQIQTGISSEYFKILKN